MPWKEIESAIRASAPAFEIAFKSQAGGGCINRCYRIEDKSGNSYFVKLNDAALLTMFEAEAEGLKEILDSKAIRVPKPLCCGNAGSQSFIVMEFISMSGSGQGDTPQKMGEQLAAMHRYSQAMFGWHRDNTIGSTPQNNRQTPDWIDFLRTRRLGFQLELAKSNGFGGSLHEKGRRLLECLERFFVEYQPQPSLLHGDLWGGNQAADQNGNPILFDPAVYYGDREADLAMTELFGGFSGKFYEAYQRQWPLDPGYGVRKNLYNLYHILNHANLFGSSYARQAETMIDSLLAEV